MALAGLCDAGWTVGDLGCGTGRLSEALAPFVAAVVAVDGSAAMLAAARVRLGDIGNVTLREGELENLPVGDEELDVVTLFLALHHVSDPSVVLAEARRVLKPGGRLLVVDMLPHDREQFRQEMGHLWLGFSQDQMRRDLAATGFSSGRVHALPADPSTKGPALFAAAARKPTQGDSA